MSNQLKKVEGERFLYFRPGTDKRGNEIRHYYLRKRSDTLDTDVSLETTSVKQAVAARDEWVAQERNRRLGIEEKKKHDKRVRIETCLEIYRKAGCPAARHGRIVYPGDLHKRSELDSIVNLKRGIRGEHVDELDAPRLDKYNKWRKRIATKGTGDRSTDLDLNTLSKALDWNVRKKVIKFNPIAHRTRYYDPANARRTKEVAPGNPEELHQVCREMFSDPRSECCAWQYLFQSTFSLRTEEALALRMDATNPEQPGHIEGRSMYVRRADKAQRTNPCIYLHDQGLVVWEALKAWHQKRYPKSPYVFPGRDTSDLKPLSKQALTKCLERLFQLGRIPRKLTAHGGRGYYVLVRRSWGIGDDRIRWEIGHTDPDTWKAMEECRLPGKMDKVRN